MRLSRVHMAAKFDYDLDFARLNFRERPELYRTGRGEQGVLLVEPYKSEILPHWRFKTERLARRSAAQIYRLYLQYKAAGDFVGMDMTRKFLQMGWTRSMRYARHKSGRKYVGPVPAAHKGESGAWGRKVAPYELDEEKLRAAKIFKEKLDLVRTDTDYITARRAHRKQFEMHR
jgi:hypothetical protein